jgi:hypothetical protein
MFGFVEEYDEVRRVGLIKQATGRVVRFTLTESQASVKVGEFVSYDTSECAVNVKAAPLPATMVGER